MLGRHRGFERDPVGLGHGVADPMLDEVEPFLLLQRGLQIRRPAEQPGFAFLADAALEHRLDEDAAVAVDQRPDLFLAGVGAEHFRRRETRRTAGAWRHAACP